MGVLRLPLKLPSYFLPVSSTNVLDDESLSSLYLCPGSSTLSSSLAPAKKRRKKRRLVFRFTWPFLRVKKRRKKRRLVFRFTWPFLRAKKRRKKRRLLFRFTWPISRFITSDNSPRDDKDHACGEEVDVRDEIMEHGSEKRSHAARRFSLKKVLKLESSKLEAKTAPGSTSCDEEQPRISNAMCRKDEGALAGTNYQHCDKLMKNVSPEFVIGQPALGTESVNHVLPVFLRMNLKKFILVLEALHVQSKALKLDMKLLKAVKGKLSGCGSPFFKEELFYQRRILMGRRCRVQHLEQSPYD